MKKSAILISFMVLGLFTGCYDDSDIWERIEKVENELGQLKERLNDELTALSDMIEGTVSIKECEVNADGSYDIELSNGVNLTIMDGADLSAAVTCKKDADGKNYWALYSEDGQTEFLTDSEGNKVPVSQAPSVISKNDENYLVIGGEEYYLAGESIFSSYTVNKNTLTDEVLSVTFGFGDAMSFTVTVDGVNMFSFIRQDTDRVEVIDNYFVSYGQTEMIATQQIGVVSYIPEMPKGWDYKKYTDEAGYKYLCVTAPSKQDIEEGKAVAEGEINVIAVLEGGKAMSAGLQVSVEPFADMSVMFDNVSVKMAPGLMKYMYGVLPADTYQAGDALSLAESLLNVSSRPEYGVAEGNMNAKLADIYGQALVPGQKYVFWAVPALWEEDSFVCADYVKEIEFTYFTISLTVNSVTFADAKVNLDMAGVTNWYGALVKADEWQQDKVLADLNDKRYAANSGAEDYLGSAFSYAGKRVVPESGKSYVVWAAVERTDGKYTEQDILTAQFTLSNLEAGGTLELQIGEAVASPTYVTVPLSCEGAYRIYYAFVSRINSTKYSTDELKAKYIFDYGTFGEGSSVEAASRMLAASPETNIVMFAMPVSADGKYGKVYDSPYKTSAIPFNNWTVTLEEVYNKPLDVRINVVVKDENGAVVEPADYLYWAGDTSLAFWKNSTSGLGKTAENAQRYMWLNVGKDSKLKTSVSGEISGGEAKFADLPVDKTCVLVLMAKDAEGGYSKATVLTFSTLSVDFGDVVWAQNEDGTPNPKWLAMQPVASEDPAATIIWRPEKFVKAVGMRPGEVGFGFNSPDGYTAYVMYGTETYMIPEDGSETDILYGRDRMIHMLKTIDKKREKDQIVGEDENGYYISEWCCFSHGNASEGAAVIFDQAGWEEHRQTCSCEEKSTLEKKIVYFNTDIVEFKAGAVGKEGADKVYVMYKDSDGNFYEPYAVDIPYTYFENAAVE